MRKLYLFLIFLPAIILCCQKEEAKLNNDLIIDGIELKSGGDKEGRDACFEVQFPLTVIMSDRTEITGDTRAELSRKIMAWYKDHKKEGKGKMTFKYPIDVLFKGEVIILQNDRQFERIRMACKGEHDGDKDRDKERDKTPCIEFVFPVSYEMADGTVIKGADPAELKKKMARWHEAHPDARDKGSLVYPVDVKFKGKALSIENERQMTRLREACKGEADGDKKVCFELVYPLKYTMPDDNILEVGSKAAADRAFKRWYEAHPDSRVRPALVFPIKIQYGKSDRGEGKIVEIEDQETLNKAYQDC